MINKVDKLTRIFLKNSYQKILNTNINSKETTTKKIFRTIGFALLFIYIAGVMGFGSYNLINQLIIYKQPAVFLGIFLLAIAGLVIVQTLFSSINVFYFSKDIEFVLPLPVKPVELLLAKFNTILITEYITEVLFGIVPIFIYGILTAASPMFYLSSILVMAIFPILPALIVSFLIVIVMSFGRLIKNKDKFQIFAIFITILLVIAMSTLTSNTKMTDAQLVEKLLQVNGLVDIYGNYFITIKTSITAMTSTNVLENIIALLQLVGITAIGYVLFAFLGKKLYLKGVVGISSSGKKTKKIKVEKAYKQRKFADAYIMKEFKILFRNPIFFVQCILPAIIMPIMMLGILVGSIVTQAGSQEAINAISNEINNPIIIYAIIGVIQFLSLMSYIAVTSISRDGQTAKFMKYIPVSLYKQVSYKIMPAIIINLIPEIIVVGVAYIAFPQLIFELICVFGLSIIINIVQSELMIIIDLKRPKLEWDTEYAVVKQNFNMLFQFVQVLIFGAILVGLGIVFTKYNHIINIGVLTVVFAAMALCVDRYIYKNQTKLFEKIQ